MGSSSLSDSCREEAADVGWEKSHTNLVAGLLQRLYHCEAASRIEIDDFWWRYTHELDFDIEEQIKGN